MDVAVGSLHAEAHGRPSLVYDLMEPLRPVLDAQVLWRRADLAVTREGKVRLSAGLARVVARRPWLDKRAVDRLVAWYAREDAEMLLRSDAIAATDRTLQARGSWHPSTTRSPKASEPPI